MNCQGAIHQSTFLLFFWFDHMVLILGGPILFREKLLPWREKRLVSPPRMPRPPPPDPPRRPRRGRWSGGGSGGAPQCGGSERKQGFPTKTSGKRHWEKVISYDLSLGSWHSPAPSKTAWVVKNLTLGRLKWFFSCTAVFLPNMI